MIEWFDFYGMSVCFTVNHESKYRTRIGVFLTMLNIILVLVFLPIEFLNRESVTHSWVIPDWQFNVTHHPTMFQDIYISN